MARETELGFKIKRVLGKDDQWGKIVKETEAFYEMLESNPAEINIGDTKQIVGQLQRIRAEYNKINNDANSNRGQIDFANLLCNVLDKAEDKFQNIGVMFKNVNNNTRKYVTGLSNIADHLADTNFGVKFLDVGAQFKELQDRAEELYDTLKRIGTDTYSGGEFSLWNGSFDKEDLRERIEILRKLKEVQNDMIAFDSDMRARDFVSGQSVSGIDDFIRRAQVSLDLLRKSGLETTEELDRLRRNFESDMNWSSLWNDEEFQKAKEHIADTEVYERSIQNLKDYISEREQLLEKLETGYEGTLFTNDETDDMISTLRRELNEARDQFKVLQDLKGKNVGIDFTDVVNALQEIKNAIREIKDAFDPLTQAFANEDSAISKMVNANVEDLNRLQEKFEQVFNNIQTLSQKDFSSKTTNVVQQTINAPGGILKTQRAELKELAKMLAQYQSAIGDLNSKSNIFKKIGLSAAGQLDFFSFDLNEVLAGIKKATTADKLDGWADVLDDYKKGIIKVANEINKIQSGLINLDPLQNQRKKDPDIINVGQVTSNVDGILTEVKSIRDQIDAEIQGIRASFEDIFKFDSLDPNFDNIKSITDTIYQQFKELQNKIKQLDFKIEIPNMDGVTEAIKVIKQEGQAAESATPKKDAFTAANQKLADSMKETGNVGEVAADGIKAEAEAVAGAYKAIATFSFKENARVSDNDFETFAEQIAANRNLKVKQARVTRGELGGLIGGSITFQDPKTLQEIQERYSVRPKEDTEDEVELYRSSYTLIENTAKAEQRAANEAERRSKAIAESNKWLIAQEDLLNKQEHKYKASSGAAKPLDGNTSLITANVGVLPGVDKTIDGLANSIRIRIQDAMGGVITQDAKNEIIKDLNALANEIQVQQARTYQSTTLRASSLETSREVYRQYISALEADAKKANVFDQMSNTIENLKQEVESFTADNFVAFLERVKKAQAEFKSAKSKFGQQSQEEKTRKAQEDAAWAEYRAEQEAAAEKERQINLAFSAKEALEAAEAEKELAQARKAATDYFDAVEKQEKKDEEAKKVKELNALYRERNTIITAIIKYNNKAETLKTDKAKQRAKDQLELERQRLAAIDDEIDKYGELINKSKLEQQNDRLTGRLRDSNVTNAITKEQKKDIEDVNRLLSRRKEVHDNILKLQKQMSSASGDEEQKAIQKEIDGQNTIYRVLTKQLATYKDIALQRKVTEQNNAFREQDNWSKIQKNIDAAASVDKTEQEDQKQNYKDILSLVEQLFDAQTALHKINTDSTGKVHTAEREEEIKKVKELSMLLKDIYGIDIKNLSGSLDKSGLLTQEQKNKLLEKEREYKQDIISLTAKAADQEATAQKKLQEKENKKSQNYGKLEFNQATKFLEKMNANVRNLGGTDNISESLNALVQDYTEAYKKIASIRKQFEEDPNAVKDEGLKAKFQDAVLHANNLKQEIQGVFKETQKLESISRDLRLGEAVSLDEFDPGDIKSSMIAYANAVSDGTMEIKGFNEAGTEMYGVIDRGNGAINSFTVALDKGTNKLHAYTTATNKASNEWEDFKTQAVSGAKNLVGMYVGFQEGVQAVRAGVGYVKDIDLAMTELKKVTDETDASYKQFLSDAGSTSAIIGSTISDFTEATATFARLGYSMEESSSMAETAIIYKNVADGLDTVEESSESIISTMMAFGIEANDTMSIIDRFNAVGNNFAITSAGIGEALQRSASALYSAGNTIDESVALVTAANSVIQNPEQVGTALKTLALRLRGAKTELEEAGLETDNMAESTSTLQAKLNALTHGKVNIMLDANTFKSTTQILREMSEAWEDMTDIERAAALELMGGKRQANILSSVIQNFETVEDVIETSMNSSGSAIAENEKWLDSIEGKTYQFTNALQTMWSNMLNSEVIKGFIDFGTDAIQFLDTGAGKVIAFVAALKLAAKFKGFSIAGIAKGLGDTINKITAAQQTLQTLSQTTKIGKGYDFTNVNAYAQAVSNLTAKQQANLLASQGLNQEQIRYALTLNQVDDAAMREAMAHVHAASAKDQEAISGNKLIQQKALEVAASLKVQAAKDGEARSTELNAAADILEQATSQDLTRDKLVEIMTSKGISSATQAEILAKLGLTNANKGLAASIKALYVLNPVGFWITVGSTILSLIPIVSSLAGEFTKSAEEIKQEANEISQAYSDAVSEINNNLESLGITFDTESISTLENEFATLAAGVDRYGNNISLTSDEYERYREICEQIVGINPSIAKGYDTATEAIGNNAGVLSQLIELQKTQMRLAAEEYISDENLEILSKDAVNDFKDATKEVGNVSENLRGKLNSFFGDIAGNQNENIMRYVLGNLGYDASEIQREINSFWLYDVNDYDISAFWLKYTDDVQNNIDKFGAKYSQGLSRIFDNAESEFAAAEAKLEKAQSGLIDTLLVAPVSSKDYDKLTSEGKNFLVDWIKNSEMFKVDGEVDDEDVQKMRDTVLDMMDILVSDAKNIEYKGEKFTAQEILGQIYDLDSSVDFGDYKEKLKALLEAFWNSLSDAQKEDYGFKDFEDFQISLGFDFVADEEAESKMIKGYARAKKISEDEARKYFDSLPTIVVQRLLQVDWNLVDENNVDQTIANAKGDPFNTISSKTYSVLSESVEGYNDILNQTHEIVANNTGVTQEYKDSLSDLGISQEELNECFDDQNPLVVKNANALNKLVKSASKNVATNVKLAKSQASLDYYNLIKKLNSTLNSTNSLDSATRNAIQSTLEQVDAVKQAIYQYQLLEDSLLGAHNAFDEFNQAQEIDALNTYGDSYVEMVQTLYDGLYKTGQVGTAQFQAAAMALIPDDYRDSMKEMVDYFNKNVAPTLQLKDDEFSFDYRSIKNFVKEGLKSGIFTGDFETFDLVEGMNLEKAAELMGMTEAQAYAMFAELDKYNTDSAENSFLSQLDDSLEGRITNITNDIEKLNRQKLELLEDGGYEANKEAIDEINQKLSQSSAELNKLGKEAYATWQEYTKNDAALAALDLIEDKQRKLTREEANTLGIEWDDKKELTVQEAYDRLLAKQLELEEPSILTAQLAIDNIDSQIAELEAKLKNPKKLKIEAERSGRTVEDIKAGIQAEIHKLEEDKVTISTTFGIELSEEDQKKLEDELNKIEEFKIGDKKFKVILSGASEVMRQLESVRALAGNVTQTVTTVYKTVQSNDKQYSGWTPSGGSSGGRYTMADGTAHVNGTAYKGGSWGAPKTETALVGELGPEMLVRNGRWMTIGDNGAEFTQVKKGDIIFNHKQTEDLLSKGYVTGRGKAYASGTAYSGLWSPVSPNTSLSNKPGNDLSSASGSMSDAAKDAADEFREVFDWIAVRLEEIDEDISFQSARLENTVGHSQQNRVVDDMIDLNEKLYDNLIAGANKYYAYAGTLLSKIPAEYRKAAQDGSIAIETFVGEVDEKTLEAIQEYREWVQKGDDAVQRAEEVITEVSTLAKQAVDNIAADFENKASLKNNKIDQLDAYNALSEAKYGSESEDIYNAIIKETNSTIKTLQTQRDKMQAELNAQVEAGNIKKYSQDWYDAVNDIAAVDTEIIELTADTYDYQDAINEIHWDNFDNLISQYEAISDEAENLIDILGSKDLVDESGNWTDEGITSLGLYAQQMENAEMQANKYKEQINYLNKNWKKLGYTEQEYLEKLDELKSGQYDAIKAYNDTKDAIVDLNKERVEAIKDGIEKEIEAYEELIDKKKEELDAEKDLYDFQKGVAEQQKDIADIERKIAALSADNSASARAKRAQLEAELLEAQAALEETYYERSISDQQDALDKELESFQNEKEQELEGWDTYLENTEQVVSDSLSTVQANTETVYDTLSALGQEYSLSITESLTSPWKDGSDAIQDFSEKFGLSMSSTVEELQKVADEYKKIMDQIYGYGNKVVEQVNDNAAKYQEANNPANPKFDPPETVVTQPTVNNTPSGGGNGGDRPSAPSTPSTPSTAGSISGLSAWLKQGNSGSDVRTLQQALNDLGFNAGTVDGMFGYNTKQAVIRFQNSSQYGGPVPADGIVGPETKKKFRVAGYAHGTTGIKKDQLSIIDELGDELVMHADGSGRLAFLSKGSAVIPHDISENLMQLGELNPQDILDRNRPVVSAPHITNNNIELNVTFGEVVHIDHVDNNAVPNLAKTVEKQIDKYMKGLNAEIRKYSR